MLATQTPTTRSPRPLLGLDDLALKSSDELDALYRAAKVSTSMHAADGALIGRMLAVRGVPGAIAEPRMASVARAPNRMAVPSCPDLSASTPRWLWTDTASAPRTRAAERTERFRSNRLRDSAADTTERA